MPCLRSARRCSRVSSGMRIALASLALMALAGCDQQPATRAKEAPAPSAPEAPRPAVASQSGWVFGMGRNSVEIAHLVGGRPDDIDLRLVCAQGDGFLLLAPGLKAVASEERLTIGAGADAYTLVAAAGKVGVQATGPVDEALLRAIESGQPIAVNHGAQSVGPFEAPPEALRRGFADTCRKLTRRGEI